MNLLKKDQSSTETKIVKLLKSLKKACVAYYNEDEKLITDEQYDIKRDKLEVLHKKLERLSPNNPLLVKSQKFLNSVGAKPTNSKLEKVKIPFVAYSLSKIKNTELSSLKKWLKKIHSKGSGLVSSPKLDGSSIFIYYKNRKIKKGFTRGDGTVGTDCTKHVKLLADSGIIPSKIKGKKKHIIIRCELLMKKTVFDKKWKDKELNGKTLKEARNAANGFINSYKAISNPKTKKFAKDLKVVAYEVLDSKGMDLFDDKLQALAFLRKAGFESYIKTPGFHVFKNDLESKELLVALNKQLKKARTKNEYECDGIVIELLDAKQRNKYKQEISEKKRPLHAVSFKVGADDLENQQVSTTTCEKVEWNTSKSGALKPLVFYKPVKFGNTTNTKANGVHAERIKELGIGKGTLLKVIRSGDVIPRIISSDPKTRKKDVFPKKCVCGAKTVLIGKDLYCSKPAKCTELALKSLIAASSHLKVDGLRKGKLEKLYEAGYTSILSLLKAKSKDIQALDGFAAKTAESICNNLHKQFQKASVSNLMVVSGAFIQPGFSLAETRIKAIVKLLGEKKVVKKLSASYLNSKLDGQKGLGDETVKCFIKGHSQFVRWYKKASKYL